MVPETVDELLHTAVGAADADAVAEYKVGCNVHDAFGHWVAACGFEGVTVKLGGFGKVTVIGLAAERGPTALIVFDLGADGGKGG